MGSISDMEDINPAKGIAKEPIRVKRGQDTKY